MKRRSTGALALGLPTWTAARQARVASATILTLLLTFVLAPAPAQASVGIGNATLYRGPSPGYGYLDWNVLSDASGRMQVELEDHTFEVPVLDQRKSRLAGLVTMAKGLT